MGCDTASRCGLSSSRHFNPRTHVGCDEAVEAVEAKWREFQSTHPRGVRQPLLHRCRCSYIFQSTHPRGVRHEDHQALEWCKQFQSTHPRGVRLVFSLLIDKFTLFQSTHPRGVRRRRQGTKKASILFQSTLPRGVRRFSCLRIFENHSISIHAPTWGAT